MTWMTITGETQGNLALSLRQVAGVYRQQVESRTTSLKAMLPSIVIIGTGAFISGMFSFAIMLPMVQLIEGLAR
jgi:type II secretory pathway component PulF